jgi:hypothetical protein
MQPDLVITTDAAVYATEYLRSALTNPDRPYPVATPITAGRGVADAAGTWPLDQGDPVERLLFDGIQAAPTGVLAHGTVTGTALQLALSLHDWPVIMAGMDFAWRNDVSHARPHVAEVHRDMASHRMDPSVSVMYRRTRTMTPVSDQWLTEPALQVYSRWFERASNRPGSRVWRLLPSPGKSSVPVMPERDLHDLPPAYSRPGFREVQWPGRDERVSLARDMVRRCLVALGTGPGVGDRASDSMRSFLLRRLALDSAIRWQRSGTDSDLSDALVKANAVLEDLLENCR